MGAVGIGLNLGPGGPGSKLYDALWRGHSKAGVPYGGHSCSLNRELKEVIITANRRNITCSSKKYSTLSVTFPFQLTVAYFSSSNYFLLRN